MKVLVDITYMNNDRSAHADKSIYGSLEFEQLSNTAATVIHSTQMTVITHTNML